MKIDAQTLEVKTPESDDFTHNGSRVLTEGEDSVQVTLRGSALSFLASIDIDDAGMELRLTTKAGHWIILPILDHSL